jgi:hypothetical protein
MDAPQMLSQMCRELLSDADVKAICKSRGFSTAEATTRAIFENFFLSDIGVAAALATLSAQEVAALHLLKVLAAEVAIPFFERAYGNAETRGLYGYTFNQRYGETYKQMQAGLLRKGVLVIGQEPDLGDGRTKMERWRCRFPKEFEKFLPSLAQGGKRLSGPGELREDVLREKVLGIVEQQPGSRSDRNDPFRMDLAKGELRIGGERFSVQRLQEWQRSRWEDALGSLAKASSPASHRADVKPIYVSPIEAATYVLGQLQPDEWLLPEALDLPLAVFCFGGQTANGQQVCTTGWEWGYLARSHAAGRTLYRLPPPALTAGAGAPEPRAGAGPASYAQPAADGGVIVSLKTAPYDALEQIVRLADLRVGSGPCLVASPNLIKMGKATAGLRDGTIGRWLRDNSPAFGSAFETVEARWGKQIVHTNLLIARITDPALRVQIERAAAAPGSLIVLSDEYIAFPRAMLGIIEKTLARSGHVIKTVQST